MQIDLSKESESLIQSKLADGISAEQLVNDALAFYATFGPSMNSLNEKLLAAHRSYETGEVEPLDAEDIKRRGRLRQSS